MERYICQNSRRFMFFLILAGKEQLCLQSFQDIRPLPIKYGAIRRSICIPVQKCHQEVQRSVPVILIDHITSIELLAVPRQSGKKFSFKTCIVSNIQMREKAVPEQ